MSAHPPPIPPDNRSPRGPGEPASLNKAADQKLHPERANSNPDEKGEQGNMRQNTTNTGYQQDR